jgi:hypothetical protein
MHLGVSKITDDAIPESGLCSVEFVLCTIDYMALDFESEKSKYF